MYKSSLIAGSIFACLAVILGAFGAHALKAVLEPDQLMIFETGVRYQFYHSFALIFTGIIYSSFPFRQLRSAHLFFLLGIILFSGSLYAMTALKVNGQAGLGGIGIITPIGGLLFILGWIMLIWGILKKK